jgi:hypothetical protein
VILPLVDYYELTNRVEVKAFISKLVRYVTEVSQSIGPDGEVRGKGWWGHLHSTLDMAAGIAEFGRLTDRPELIEWSRRLYQWVGRTHTTRCGWVADSVGSSTCESCAIASRFRLGLALYRAGVLDPFGEIDRYLRNQLLENQFIDLSFLPLLKPETPRTAKATYAGIPQMIRGTFQCWAKPNDLIGHDDIEGCGAGGGLQGLALAWNAQYEWRKAPAGSELRVNLLLNRRIRAEAKAPLTTGTPIAAELWSYLPQEGRVALVAHQAIPRLALRLPDGIDETQVRLQRTEREGSKQPAENVQGKDSYVMVENVLPGERVELRFPLKQYETDEPVQGEMYHVSWKGDAVTSIDPKGKQMPLYADRQIATANGPAVCSPRYP